MFFLLLTLRSSSHLGALAANEQPSRGGMHYTECLPVAALPRHCDMFFGGVQAFVPKASYAYNANPFRTGSGGGAMAGMRGLLSDPQAAQMVCLVRFLLVRLLWCI